MAATFLVVPEWQGSGSSRAMQLIDGADAILGDLPASITRRLDIPLGAGESLGSGVSRASALRSIRDSVEVALSASRSADDRPDDIVVTIGGDCGVELAPIADAVRLHPGVAIVWLDAHADLLEPPLPGSGAFSSMVLRTLLGDGTELLVPDFNQTVSPARLVLAGVRSVEEEEQQYIDDNHVRVVSVDDLQRAGDDGGSALVDAVASTGAAAIYLHVDLDVLDPAEITGVSYPEPFGVSVAALTANILALRSRFELVGAGITQFAPASPDAAADDLSAVLRIISSLTKAL